MFIRNTFSFLNITLFRPECEVNISYKATWLIKLGTPALLIYVVVIVWFVHRYCFKKLLEESKTPQSRQHLSGIFRTSHSLDSNRKIVVDMCAQGQCSNFGRYYLAKKLYCTHCARLPPSDAVPILNHRAEELHQCLVSVKFKEQQLYAFDELATEEQIPYVLFDVILRPAAAKRALCSHPGAGQCRDRCRARRQVVGTGIHREGVGLL